MIFLSGYYYRRRKIELVAKPYTKSNETNLEDCWRMSTSNTEREVLNIIFINLPQGYKQGSAKS